MQPDPYDICVAFDDIYEPAQPAARAVGGDVRRATRNIIRRAKRKRIAVPLRVAPAAAAADTTAWSFQVGGRAYEVLGGAPGADNLAAAGFPIYASALRCFCQGQPLPKLVRLDLPDTYARFRADRRSVCCADLDDRVRALESLIAQHVADQHGSGRVAALRADFDRHLAQHHAGDSGLADYSSVVGAGAVIPVVRQIRGKVECWQDGDEICCTVRFLTPGGVAMLTTGTPVQRHLEEALRCASVPELDCALPVLDRLAQVLGSTELIPELCRTALILSTSAQTSPMIGVMFPQSTPAVAAAMALLQRCQQGDGRARAEVRAMESGGAGELLGIAAERLVRAQRTKARTAGVC